MTTASLAARTATIERSSRTSYCSLVSTRPITALYKLLTCCRARFTTSCLALMTTYETANASFITLDTMRIVTASSILLDMGTRKSHLDPIKTYWLTFLSTSIATYVTLRAATYCLATSFVAPNGEKYRVLS